MGKRNISYRFVAKFSNIYFCKARQATRNQFGSNWPPTGVDLVAFVFDAGVVNDQDRVWSAAGYVGGVESKHTFTEFLCSCLDSANKKTQNPFHLHLWALKDRKNMLLIQILREPFREKVLRKGSAH